MDTTRPFETRSRAALSLALVALAAIPASAPARADEEIDKELATVARQVSAFLNRYEKHALAVGQFTGPPQLNASAGPGIAKSLADELKECGVEVRKVSDLGLKGEYRLNLKGGTRGPEALIRGDIEDLSGKRVFSFTRKVRGEGTLASLFGLTVNLPPAENEDARGRRLVASITAPETLVRKTRISAGGGSPFAVEVLVKDGDKYTPRAPTEVDRLAFVKIDRGETYAVRLINDSDSDAAVTLSVDGLNMFAFSENSDYRYVIVGAHGQGQIPGWYVNNARSDAFRVVEYGKSEVARLLPGSAGVGTVTATFASAWPRDEKAPADELHAPMMASRGGDATGRGPSVETNYKVVERYVGVVRSSVSVRYTKGE